MRGMRHLVTVVVGVVAVVGVLAAEPVYAQDKLAKYQAPASISNLDWILTQINLDMMRDIMVDNRDTVEVPIWYYDRLAKKIRASVRVVRSFGKGPLEKSRSILLGRVSVGFITLQASIPEVAKSDVEIVFYYHDNSGDGGLRRVEFAFYKNGELTFR